MSYSSSCAGTSYFSAAAYTRVRVFCAGNAKARSRIASCAYGAQRIIQKKELKINVQGKNALIGFKHTRPIKENIDTLIKYNIHNSLQLQRAYVQ